MREADRIAREIVAYNEMAEHRGGNRTVHKSCSLGMVLKWLMFKRREKYEDFGKAIGVTRQGVNHIVNRMDRESFTMGDLDKYAKHFGISVARLLEFESAVMVELNKNGSRNDKIK